MGGGEKGIETGPFLSVWRAVATERRTPKTEEEDDMAEEGKIYVCDLCGQEVKVTKSGVGTLVCCDVPMHVKSSEG